MERSTTEEITNFWSHFPQGLTYRELCAMSREERFDRAARPAAEAAVNTEVQLELVQLDSEATAA